VSTGCCSGGVCSLTPDVAADPQGKRDADCEGGSESRERDEGGGGGCCSGGVCAGTSAASAEPRGSCAPGRIVDVDQDCCNPPAVHGLGSGDSGDSDDECCSLDHPCICDGKTVFLPSIPSTGRG